MSQRYSGFKNSEFIFLLRSSKVDVLGWEAGLRFVCCRKSPACGPSLPSSIQDGNTLTHMIEPELPLYPGSPHLGCIQLKKVKVEEHERDINLQW